MGDRDDYKSKKYKEKSRKRRRYEENDDDDYKYHREKHTPKKNLLERILTPGQATNNLIKTTATGLIFGSTVFLMLIYGWLGERIAGSNSYLPAITALSSATATASVWIFGRSKSEDVNKTEFNKIKKELLKLNKELDQLDLENADLEQRLAAVEMLESFEDKLAKRTLEKQDHGAPSEPKPALDSRNPSSSSDSDTSSANNTSVAETE